YGDASHATVLKAAGASDATTVIVTLDQPGACERTVHALRHHFPKARIFVRARDHRLASSLLTAGASVCIPETLESSLQLGGAALRDMGIGEGEVEKLIVHLRQENYQRIHPEI
ncbi:MAG: potassium transporter KefB, partial [Rhodospirillales bacterium]